MAQLTANKPKALIPFRGKPLLFHTLDLFPDADIVVIGDYKIDVLRRYMEAFGRHEHCRIVSAHGAGTCAGVAEAASNLDPNAPAFLSWCDLVYSTSPDPLFGAVDKPAIGLSQSFPCRWSFQDGQLMHVPSSSAGVAGCFWFPQTSSLGSVPPSGEFCEYLASLSDMDLVGVPLGDTCTRWARWRPMSCSARVNSRAVRSIASPWSRTERSSRSLLIRKARIWPTSSRPGTDEPHKLDFDACPPFLTMIPCGWSTLAGRSHIAWRPPVGPSR